DAGDVGAAPLGHGVEQAGALVAEGETGFFAEAEGAGVVVELALAGEHGELGRAVVAGFADDLGDAHGRGGGMVVAHEAAFASVRSEEHTSELQSRENLVCRLLLEK